MIDRELLEQLHPYVYGPERVKLQQEVKAILAAPRQPEGEGLEVVAWQDADNPLYTTAERRQMHGWATDGYPIVELCRLSDHQRVIAELREECERLRMQLAACGVVALANTPESASEARQMHQDYMSASCSDVAGAVDREMTLRQQLAERDAEIMEQCRLNGMGAERELKLLTQRDKLAGLLREWRGMFDGGLASGQLGVLRGQTDAALAALSAPLTISTADIQSPPNKD